MNNYLYKLFYYNFLAFLLFLLPIKNIYGKTQRVGHRYEKNLLKQIISDINETHKRKGIIYRDALLPHEEKYAIEKIVDSNASYSKNYAEIKKYMQEQEHERTAKRYKDSIINSVIDGTNTRYKTDYPSIETQSPHFPWFILKKYHELKLDDQQKALLLEALEHIDHQTPPQKIDKIIYLARKCILGTYKTTFQDIIGCIKLAVKQ